MTDNTPAGSAPKRTPAAKTPAAKATSAKAAAPKTAAVKTAAPKASAAKAPTAKASAAKPPATKASTPKTTPTKKTPAPVATAPASTAPAAAVAPAGWYPAAAGSSQQRWWDGSQWTEHVYGAPAAQPVATNAVTANTAAAGPALRAAAGVKPGTVWFWLLAVGAPVLTILDLIPTSIYLSQVIGGDTTDPTAIVGNTFNAGYLLVFLSGWFIYAVCIVFALLDWRELKAHGVPSPFHWAWSFFVLLIGWPAVYMIGRAVVVKRRTGAGLAPLWVFIGLEVVAGIVTLVVVIAAIAQFFSVLSDLSANAGNVF